MTVPRAQLLGAIAERIAHTCDDLVLRGGFLTHLWVPQRAVRDLDYAADFAFDVAATRDRVARAVPDEDLRAEGIWLDTPFPGVRLRAGEHVAIDVGFGDPLVPEPTRVTIGSTSVRCVRPETQLAWKLHALAEMQASFRPKDVADLWLLARYVAMTPELISRAIPPAFTSRGFPLETARVLDAPYWATKTARVRWEPYRARIGELADVLDAVRAVLRGPLEGL
jgi:hypothetical protein